jgi:hypothetical protein
MKRRLIREGAQAGIYEQGRCIVGLTREDIASGVPTRRTRPRKRKWDR